MSSFQILDNQLLAHSDLCWENHAEFREKCDELISLGFDEIILDLTNVTFIFSAYMGTIGQLLGRTAGSGQRLTIRVSENLFWLFEMAGFEKMINIEVVSA